MQRFERDDEGFLAWRAAHPAGFIVNCNPTPSLDYLMLHRASCHFMNELPKDYKHWTHAFIKVCAEEKGVLSVWCHSEVGGAPSSCQHCDPMAPA